MENYNYYQVQGWMINNLFLKGNELICYAIIYSFSQDNESQYMGGVKYLKSWMNVSEPTVISVLEKLVKKGLIEPTTVITRSCKRIYYQVTKESLERGNLKNLSKVTKESLESQYNINNNNKENNKEKRLSNDNRKVQEENDFSSFYKLYPLKKSKTSAERAWNKLSAKDKKEAIDKLPYYLDDCLKNNRSFKYPATYLNGRTWEDDFGVKQKVGFYDAVETDSDEKKRYKEWMRKTFPEIENTALPLSYEDYKILVGQQNENVTLVGEILEEIHQEVWKYRKSDIATIVRFKLNEYD